MENKTEIEDKIKEENKAKVKALYEYLGALYEKKNEGIDNYCNYSFYKELYNITKYKNYIKVNTVLSSAEESKIISIKKPDFIMVPSNIKKLLEVVKIDVTNFKYEVDYLNEKTKVDEDGKSLLSKSQIEQYNKLIAEREEWRKEQLCINEVRELFDSIYDIYNRTIKDDEGFELVLGNGIFRTKDAYIKHPIITKKVFIKFLGKENILEIVDNENSLPIFEMSFFKNVNSINQEILKDFKLEVEEEFYHPLDTEETVDFFKNFINSVSSDSKYLERETGENTEKFYLVNNPVIILRKKEFSIASVLNEIASDLEEAEPPTHLLNLVGANIPDEVREDIEISIHADEEKDIYMTKEANREQIEIAKKIEMYDAVVVQGPPGTGKTHTIANLTGHLLAQGKNVLVTSQTKKALKVLKDKLDAEIQNLCVSLIDDNNSDMEKSIVAISDFLGMNTSKDIAEKVNVLKIKRNDLIDNVKDIREKITNIRQMEYKNILYNGKGYSPSELAKIASAYDINECIITGELNFENGGRGKENFPFDKKDLEFLFYTNTYITEEDEYELEQNIENIKDIISINDFTKYVESYSKVKNYVEKITSNKRLGINEFDIDNKIISIKGVKIESVEIEKLVNFKKRIEKAKSNIINLSAIDISVLLSSVNSSNDSSKLLTLSSELEKAIKLLKEIEARTFGKVSSSYENNELDNLNIKITNKKLSLNGCEVELPSDKVVDIAHRVIEDDKDFFYELSEIEVISVLSSFQENDIINKFEIINRQLEDIIPVYEALNNKTFGIEIVGEEYFEQYSDDIKKLEELFENNKKIGFIDKLLNKKFKEINEKILIDGKPLSEKEHCKIILEKIELNKRIKVIRNMLVQVSRESNFSYLEILSNKQVNIIKKELDNAVLMNELMIDKIKLAVLEKSIVAMLSQLAIQYEVNDFNELSKKNLLVIENEINNAIRFLDWYNQEYSQLKGLSCDAGLGSEVIFNFKFDDKDMFVERGTEFLNIILTYTSVLENIYYNIPNMLNIFKDSLVITIEKLEDSTYSNSKICKQILRSIKENDTNGYSESYKKLFDTCNKGDEYKRRKEIIDDISEIAPTWANEIATRKNENGTSQLPTNIEYQWQIKVFRHILNKIKSYDYEELLSELDRKRFELKNLTVEISTNMAWYHLCTRIEGDKSKKQSLENWKLYSKKIGKGTGKRANKYRKDARREMEKCQTAVPAWIMPMTKALESLNARENKFDVIIVDEASQSDISALAIMYLGKKIIIVGDDEQVSPTNFAGGFTTEAIEQLEKQYIKGVISNSSLFTKDTSLYDIALTTFTKAALKEHFRCVPEIIDYSNRLCYNGSIKPLRDEGSVVIKPATTTIRVNGERLFNKTNVEEADKIVSLISACIEQPEYDGMTFGVITLLGSGEQAKLIQQKLIQELGTQIMEERQIISGTPAQFQGDERDVIFLSFVDSNENEGPLRMTSDKKENKQRYNVAVSRAKNQIWGVHSLDVNNDLKTGDIRKDLLDHLDNPRRFIALEENIDSMADSPFEVEVSKALLAQKYKFIQQYKVGSAYRLDIVAQYGDKKIAIECDGELYHSGYDKIAQDMERQAILERLGWKFIRIRGSEFYSDKDKTMKRVFKELNEYGIYPDTEYYDNGNIINSETQGYELRNRVIRRANEIVEKKNSDIESEI